MKKNKIYILLLSMMLVLCMLTGCKKSAASSATQAQTTKAETTTVAPETTSTEKTTAAETTTVQEATTKEETTAAPETTVKETTTVEETTVKSGVTEDGQYTSKDEVAEYIHKFGKLPSNYITKQEAQDLGWVASRGNLWDVAPGMSIGGDKFGNYEGILPKVKGRKYFECDIDFDGKYRNALRIIFSNDGLVYYTEDHYESFTLLYGEE